MDVSDLVRGHYAGGDLEEAVLSALGGAGVDTDHLEVADLAAVDQLHAGFLPATHYLLEQLDLGPRTTLLDVGAGIGGPARVAAAAYGCPVVAVDLSPDFVRAGRWFTDQVGLGGLVRHRVCSAVELDLADASVDRAMMVHVGMNIADKPAVFAEVHRALSSGGRFVLFEQMRIAAGALSYPLPWAEDDQSSFLASPEDYVRDLEAAGFRIDRVEDRTAATAGPQGPPGPLSPASVFGPRFVERMANNVAATRAGLLAPVLVVAHRT